MINDYYGYNNTDDQKPDWNSEHREVSIINHSNESDKQIKTNSHPNNISTHHNDTGYYIIPKGTKYMIEIEMIKDVATRDFTVRDSIYDYNEENRKTFDDQFVVNRLMVRSPDELRQSIMKSVMDNLEIQLKTIL